MWLRRNFGADGISQFAYSLDGKNFTALGGSYPLSWGSYRGDRIGVFCYNEAGEKGWFDVDWFHYTVERAKAGKERE